MKPTTRLRILDHIRKYQTASVKELSIQMGMSGANIRHHLAVLENNDLIEVVGMRQEGRGRPRQVYGLSRRVLGDGLDILSASLLDIWKEDMTVNNREGWIRSLASKLAGDINIIQPIMRRVISAVSRLNELHYQARWEASAAGPRIILGHCPYAVIVAEHPELCQMDSFLLESKLGSRVEQNAKLLISDKGLPYCAFLKVEN